MGKRTDAVTTSEGSPDTLIIPTNEAQFVVNSTDNAAVEPVWETTNTDDASASDAPVDVQQARAQIEETRAELSETIDAIKEKLAPGRVVEETREKVRSTIVEAADPIIHKAQALARDFSNDPTGTAKQLGADILAEIKRKPTAAAIAGLAVGLLILRARHKHHYETRVYRVRVK